MRKGTASVGDAAVGRRWVLRWEEVVKGTPAAAYAGEKMESLNGRGSPAPGLASKGGESVRPVQVCGEEGSGLWV
jgi:hypothetical protein